VADEEDFGELHGQLFSKHMNLRRRRRRERSRKHTTPARRVSVVDLSSQLSQVCACILYDVYLGKRCLVVGRVYVITPRSNHPARL
jgi:hypothetical protein